MHKNENIHWYVSWKDLNRSLKSTNVTKIFKNGDKRSDSLVFSLNLQPCVYIHMYKQIRYASLSASKIRVLIDGMRKINIMEKEK